MAERRPLVWNGSIQELPTGDTVESDTVFPTGGPQGAMLTKANATTGAPDWDPVVPTGVSPASILNLGPDLYGRVGCSHFSLQLGRDGDSSSITRSSLELARGWQEDPYFVPNTARTAVKMRVSVGAPVVGSSTSARCELREQDPDGLDYGFDALTGTHVFHGRSTIVSAPDVLPDIVLAQLHNGSNDRVAFRTQLVSGTWRLRLRINGSSVATTLGTDMATGQGTIEGTEYEWKIEIVSNVAKFYLNDMVTPVYTSGAAIFSSTGSSSWYFKAGCYLQTKADGSDGDSLSDYGLVELRDVWHTHTGWASPATYYATAPHKATHATGGQDELTKGDIGLGNVDNTSNATERAATATLTNKRITKRVGTTASSATPTANADDHDIYMVTALAAGATFGAPTGTPTNGQMILYRIKDNGTARTLAWNAVFRAVGVTLPTTTVISKTLYLLTVYNSADSVWDVLSVGQQA